MDKQCCPKGKFYNVKVFENTCEEVVEIYSRARTRDWCVGTFIKAEICYVNTKTRGMDME